MHDGDALADRMLRWDGCANVRDLGGLALETGGATRWRMVVRADSLPRLSPAGRAALRAYGVMADRTLRWDGCANVRDLPADPAIRSGPSLPPSTKPRPTPSAACATCT